MNIKTIILFALLCVAATTAFAQIGIGTFNPDSSAVLHVQSTTKGLLAPRMSNTQMGAIAGPAAGLTVFNTDSSRYFIYAGGSWVKMLTAKDTLPVARMLSDKDADTKVEVEKTADDDRIRFTLAGKEYFRMNKGTIEFNNTGSSIYLGEGAGVSHNYTLNPLFSVANIGIGANSLQNDSTGINNIAIGKTALFRNNGNENTAVGNYAGNNSYSPSRSVFLGYFSGNSMSGIDNVLLGAYTGLGVSTGSDNVFVGNYAGQVSTGSSNIFIGKAAGLFNTAGSGNIFIGSAVTSSNSVNNTLMVDNSNTGDPLLYGDFSADSLLINGTLNINKKYILPKTAGSNGDIMRTDGAGTTAWVSPSSILADVAQIKDADGNTTVEVERTTNDDQIWFKLGGTDEWVMKGSRLENVNSGTLSVGRDAGLNESTPGYNAYFGINAGKENLTGASNTAVGNNALRDNTASRNVAVGYGAATANTTGGDNVAVGVYTLSENTGGNNNTAVGNEALYNSQTGNRNVALGINALRTNQTGSGNIALGSSAGYYEAGSDKLYIDNSSTTTPLIYGDFAADSLRINGQLNINGYYTLPKTAGTNGYLMQTNGSGTASWVAPSTLSLSKIQDVDGDTRIEVERTSNDNKIRFKVNGDDRWQMTGLRLENTVGSTVVVGREAGMTEGNTFGDNAYFGALAGRENYTGQQNVAVGYRSLQNNTASHNVGLGYATGYNITTGADNLAAGTRAMVNITTGSRNVALGMFALFNNKTGSGNVAIGYDAGASDTTSDKLFIDNNSTSTPLIFGDFANDSLRINGRLNVNGNYTLPTTAGTNGYVMQTDGAGNTSWANATALITESDPQVSSSTTNKVPKWNGTTLTDGLIYDNGTSVGIGTAPSNTESSLVLGAMNSTVEGGQLQLRGVGFYADYYMDNNSGNLRFMRGLPSSSTTTLMTLTNDGNLGVGTTNTPSAKVDVNGNIHASDTVRTSKFKMTNGAAAGHVLTSDANGNATWANPSGVLTESDPQVSSSTTNKVPKWNGTTLTDGIIYDNGTAVGIGTAPSNAESSLVLGAMNSTDEGGQLQLRGAGVFTDYYMDNNSGNLRFIRGLPSSSNTTMMTLTNDGNLGVGTTATPAARVDVIGNIYASDTVRTSKFKMTNGAAAGRVLTSDAAGNAGWTAPQVSSSAVNRYPYWDGTTLTDGNIYRNSSNGFIGIGVSNAAVPLETNGSVRFSSSTNADIQLNSGTRPTIYPSGPNVPTNLEVQLRSAGSSTLFFNLDNTGNISTVAGGGNMMVGAGIPTAKLDVGCTFKLGSDGSVLTSVIKNNYSVSTASIGANSAVVYTITVTGAATGASVSVSPNADMPNGVYIASARVSSANTVSLKIYNTIGSSVSLSGVTNYYVTVVN